MTSVLSFSRRGLLWSSAAALVMCLGAGAACSGSPLAVEVSLPSDLAERAVWFEVGAYKGATCAGIEPMLTNGVPEGATARVAFKKDSGSPKLGDIPNGKYAFAAVARDDNCTVLARGCREVEVDDPDKVTIALEPAPDASGQCPALATCQAGMCVPANDNANPSVGAGCSLELLGAGPLVSPITGDGTLMSAPAIVATSAGFVIGYREVDSSGSNAVVVLLPIDGAGGALTADDGTGSGKHVSAAAIGIIKRCATEDEIDGVGLVVNDNDEGKLTLAKPACGGVPQLEVLNFKASTPEAVGQPKTGRYVVNPSTSETKLSLAPTRSTSARPSGDVVVFTQGGTALIDNVTSGDAGITGPSGTFGGTTGVTNAWVSANETVLALLAAAPASPVPPSPTIDDAGGDGGETTTPGDPIETDFDSELRLLVLPSSTAIDSIDAQKNLPRAPITFSGTWGSLATLGGRVIVLSDNLGAGHSANFRTYDLGSDSASNSTGFAVEGEGNVTAGDVFALGNRAYFAVLKEKAIGLHVFDNASTTLTPLRDVAFATVPRISAISTIRDGRVAVTATDSRVAVAWTTASRLGEYDIAGGYAVFACTNPK